MDMRNRAAVEKRNRRRKRIIMHRVVCALSLCAFVLFMIVMCGFRLQQNFVDYTKGNKWEQKNKLLDKASSSQTKLVDDNQEDNWKLVLVNPWNPISDTFEITLKQLKNGHSIDERCYPELQDMMNACRQEGMEPLICSSYRTWEKQNLLYQKEVNKLIRQGYEEDTAKELAATSNAVPGTSEHQLGLALDIVDSSNQRLDGSQEDTAVQAWLMENSWRYGFILRYPEGKSDITGIIYEPWHYRYVGKTAAKEIYEQGICLEEYVKGK